MTKRGALLAALAWFVLSGGGASAVAAPPDVPPDLQPWRDWVLDQEDFRRCPFLANSDGQAREAYVCAWPERLSLDVTATGARFAQRWTVYADSWVPLPGDEEHWPRDVAVNGAEAAVVATGGRALPRVRLTPGTYLLNGSFRWARRPEALPVPDQIALVALTVDGAPIAQPERPAGAVWLGKRRTAQQQEQMEIQVYRRVDDQIPVRLTTLLRLQIAGEGREELLARVLPEGFAPLALEGNLPARIEPDGRLRVQARAGSWVITIIARGPGVAESLRRPAANGPWAREEIWSFAADDRLRVVAVEGASGVDPAQTGVPPEWRDLPAYAMTADGELRIVERSRGLAAGDDNELRLHRTLWLDFDHDGYTIVDAIGGRMREDWRLDVAAPQRLQSATGNGENLLITHGAVDGLSGVELREPNVNLRAVSRVEAGGALSATGWQGRFAGVEGLLHVPPGHRLLTAIGADDASWAWVERWRLLDLFLVLIATAAVARLFGWSAGLLALVALGLTHHDNDGQMVWLWINLLIAFVLAREAPEGRLRRVALGYRNVSALALLVVLIPFAFAQVRLALYPQLEHAYSASPWDLASVAPAAAPAPSPMPEAPAEFDGGVVAQDSLPRGEESFVVTGSAIDRSQVAKSAGVGLNYQQVIQRYAPDTLVQTGPGVPNWRYDAYPFSWSGPVDSSQSLRFVIVTPFWLGLWRIVGCVLLVALLLLIVNASFGQPALPAWTRRLGVGAPMLLLALLPQAQLRAETPDAAVLQELKARLTRAPDCVPACGDVMHARVRASGDRLEVALDVSALQAVAVPIPAANGRWEPDSIDIDGQANGGVWRDGSGTRWLALRAGAHDVRLSGRIAPGDSLALEFPMRPRTVEVVAEGWDASGLGDGRLLTSTLELVRQRGAGDAARMDAGREFPPFVRVHRHVVLDLDWSVSTEVTRIAPEKGAFTLRVPLLPGEAVLTEGVEVRDDRSAVVAIPGGASGFGWASGLPRAESLELTFAGDGTRTEVWSFAVSPQWHATFKGVPAVLPQEPDAPQWIFEFHPRDGEKLAIAITRPKSVEGATLAIDGVVSSVDVGKRTTSGSLELRYRSSQGGRHTIALPEAARVTAVESDGRSVALRPDKGELTLALVPGAHSAKVQWQIDGDIGARASSPPIDLRTAASNVVTRLGVPEDRWVLFAFGPGVGPAVLYWSELAVFLALALLIGTWRHSPLRTHEWLLLGLGLSTFSWGVLLLFAGWLFVLRWRERTTETEISSTWFNARQAGLALLSVVALIGLVAAIPNGLLGTPDMSVRGPGTDGTHFGWFVDSTAGALPQSGVVSISLWWYRAAMLAWALWLSFALLRWVPWAWRVWTRDGLWRARPSYGKPPGRDKAGPSTDSPSTGTPSAGTPSTTMG